MSDAYTRPERATERELARRMRIKVTAAGGCAYCTHRATNWGGCEITGRTFPLCLKTPGTSFEPDYDRLQGDL